MSLRVAAAAFAFAVTALIGRMLGDAVLGRLGLLLAIVDVAAGIVGPALDATLVRFASRTIGPGHDASLPYFQRIFRVKIVVAAGMLVCGAVLARPLLTHMGGLSERAGIEVGGVILAFAGAGVLTLLGFAQAYYQAHLRMAQYAFIEFANATLRLVLVAGVLAVLRDASASILLSVYVTSSALVTLGGYARLPRAVFRKCPDKKISLREPLRFAGWVVVAAVCTTIAHRVDIIILGVLGFGGSTIGQYVAAFTMARLGDLGIITLFSILLPRASSLGSAASFRRFLNHFLPMIMVVLLAGAPVYLGAKWAVPLVFGGEFVEAGLLCGILSLGVLVSFGAAPGGAALYGMGRSGHVAVLEMLKLAGIAGLGVFAARRYGILGMAWTVATVRATIGIATYVCAYYAAKYMGEGST
ncbi:MAG: oligosaccharide flippase family protein [Candidatus Hydrogenedentota bacterium]